MSYQIGICSYFNPELDVLRTAELLHQAHFKALTVWGADRDCISPMPKLYKEQLRLSRKEFGFVFDSMHAPFLITCDLSSSDDSVRREAVDRVKLAIDDACELQIPIVIIHAHRTGSPQQLCARGKHSLSEIVAAAGRANVRLAVENTLASIEPLEWCLREFPADNLGLCYDSGHDRLIPGKTFDLLRRWGHRLLTTHIQDNQGQDDDHLPPGQGSIDWRGFARAFPWATYQGVFMLESTMNSALDDDPAEFLARARAGAQNILSLAGQTSCD